MLPEDKEKTTQCFTMLDEMIGLEEVKSRIKKVIAYAKLKKDLEAEGKEFIPIALNMCFVGNPGTAKTSVARILAGILYEIGLLSNRYPLEVGRADLVAQYVGQTADRVKDIFRRSRGKLLFIDEAYSLSDQKAGSFGDEAINTIVQKMENHRDETVVVFAGYPKEMDAFMSRNPGLRSRVPFVIRFDDYSSEELTQIAEAEAHKRGFSINPSARKKIQSVCKAVKKGSDFGNGRFCRTLIESAVLNYSERIYSTDNTKRKLVLTAKDFEDACINESWKQGIVDHSISA